DTTWKPLGGTRKGQGDPAVLFREAVERRDAEEAWWVWIANPAKAIPTRNSVAAVPATSDKEEVPVARGNSTRGGADDDDRALWIKWVQLLLGSGQVSAIHDARQLSESLAFAYRVIRVVAEYLRWLRATRIPVHAKDELDGIFAGVANASPPRSQVLPMRLDEGEYRMILDVLKFAAGQPGVAGTKVGLSTAEPPHETDVDLSGLGYALVREMPADGVRYNSHILNSMLSLCRDLGNVQTARDVLHAITGEYFGLDNLSLSSTPRDSIARPRRGWVVPNARSLELLLETIKASTPPELAASQCIGQVDGDTSKPLSLLLPEPSPATAGSKALTDSLVTKWRAVMADSVYRTMMLFGVSAGLETDLSLLQSQIVLFGLYARAGWVEQAMLAYEALSFTASLLKKHHWNSLLGHASSMGQWWVLDRVLHDALTHEVVPASRIFSQWYRLRLFDPEASRDGQAIDSIAQAEELLRKVTDQVLEYVDMLNPTVRADALAHLSRGLLALVSAVHGSSGGDATAVRLEDERSTVRDLPATTASQQVAKFTPAVVIKLANNIFRSISSKHWTVAGVEGMAVELCQIGRVEDAKQMIEHAYYQQHIPVSLRAINAVMSAFTAKGDPATAIQLFQWLQSNSGDGPELAGEASAHLPEEASTTPPDHPISASPPQLPLPNIHVYTAVMKAYITAGKYEDAVSVGQLLRSRQAEEDEAIAADITATAGGPKAPRWVDAVFYTTLIQALVRSKQTAEALYALEEMRERGIQPTVKTYTTLLSGFGRMGSEEGISLTRAIAYVDTHMSHALGNELTTAYYNALMEAYSRINEPWLAFQTWEVMKYRKVPPDNATASILIDTCGWSERLDWDSERTWPNNNQMRLSTGSSSSSGDSGSANCKASTSTDTSTATPAPSDFSSDSKSWVSRLLLTDQGAQDKREDPITYPFIYRLGSILHDFEQSGLKLNLNNYASLIESLIRSGAANDALNILIHELHAADESSQHIKLDKRILAHTRGMLQARKLTAQLEMLDQFIRENFPQEWYPEIVKWSTDPKIVGRSQK
ncbi:hypothetical protein EV182_001530, partial [Spiromyces aspiralis]